MITKLILLIHLTKVLKELRFFFVNTQKVGQCLIIIQDYHKLTYLIDGKSKGFLLRNIPRGQIFLVRKAVIRFS